MTKTPTNLTHVDELAWTENTGAGNTSYRSKDLSGEHIGVYIEELPPGSLSSVHHFHTLEEEHVLMLEGQATLILGNEESVLSAGDHIWFAANVEVAHHLENRSDTVCRFLVFGERTTDDIVVYPEHNVMLVKALGRKAFTTRPFRPPGSDDD
jgi:uncharacterized cupin superfamily protein